MRDMTLQINWKPVNTGNISYPSGKKYRIPTSHPKQKSITARLKI